MSTSAPSKKKKNQNIAQQRKEIPCVLSMRVGYVGQNLASKIKNTGKIIQGSEEGMKQFQSSTDCFNNVQYVHKCHKNMSALKWATHFVLAKDDLMDHILWVPKENTSGLVQDGMKGQSVQRFLLLESPSIPFYLCPSPSGKVSQHTREHLLLCKDRVSQTKNLSDIQV